MSAEKSKKPRLHPRNKNKGRYDFKKLVDSYPELSQFVVLNKHGDKSIDFANPCAVKALNKAILKHHYAIGYWDIPTAYLCPPIPGRADYIHHISDLLQRHNYGKIPIGEDFVCLDIGVGANCIYPILGITEYGWSFVGSDIDKLAIDSATQIVASNPTLKGNIEFRLQKDSKDIFFGIIQEDEHIDLTICNPPFHASAQEAQAGTLRKLNNLNPEKVTEPKLNFGGQSNELWYEGGEAKFVQRMIRQSKYFAKNCFWFSTLVSKQSNLKVVRKALIKTEAVEVETIPMGQGNKTSRVVAWTFLDKAAQNAWKNKRWKLK